MKRNIMILLFSLFAFSISAQSLTQQAAAAYNADKYSEAIELYNRVLHEEGVSSDLYYNLGNCYYKSGLLGKAVLCYERALLYNPNNEDALTNLAFVNSKLADKIVDDENIVHVFFQRIVTLTTSNGWAIIAIVSFLLLIGAVALYIFSGVVLLRKIGFFGGGVFLIVAIAANVIAFQAASRIKNHNYAIVQHDSVILSTSPREPKNKTEEAFMLHVGAKVELLDSLISTKDSVAVKWYEVKAGTNNRAWIKGEAIEKI